MGKKPRVDGKKKKASTAPKVEEEKPKPVLWTGAEEAQAGKAFAALREWAEGKGKLALFDDEAGLVRLTIHPKVLPAHLGMRVEALELPFPFRTPDTASVCLFVKDLEREKHDADVDKDARLFQEYLAVEKGLAPGTVSEIISLRQLKREYQEDEAKQLLTTAHDVFVCDARVLREVHRNLAAPFRKAAKLPTAVDLVNGDVKGRLERALGLSTLVIRGSSTRCSLKLGRLQQSDADLVGNFTAVKRHLEQRFPGGWANVRSLYVSLHGSPQLPVYADLSGAKDVVMPKAASTPGPVEGELSTLDPDELNGATQVRVFPDGRVELLDAEGGLLPMPVDLDTRRPDEVLFKRDPPSATPKTVVAKTASKTKAKTSKAKAKTPAKPKRLARRVKPKF